MIRKILILAAGALFLRLGLAFLPITFWLDYASFSKWTITAIRQGISGFYGNTMCDYPPATIYILWLWGKLYQWILDPNLAWINGMMLVIWIKIIPITMDMMCAAVLYHIVKVTKDSNSAYRASAFYLFNPAIFFVSSVWGQIDSLLMLGMLLAVWYLYQDKIIPFCLSMAVTILIKPQGAFLLPLFLVVLYNRCNYRYLLRLLIGSISSLVVVWLIIFPTVPDKTSGVSLAWQPFTFFYNKMHTTGSSYPDSTVSAFNIWTFTGPWLPDNRSLFGITHWLIGLGIVISIAVIIGYRTKRNPNHISPYTFFLSSAILLMGVFLCATRMHERYILPPLAFLSISAGLNRKVEKIYFAYSVTGLINIVVSFAPFFKPINGICAVINEYAGILVVINLGLFYGLFRSFFKEPAGQTAPTLTKGTSGVTLEK